MACKSWRRNNRVDPPVFQMRGYTENRERARGAKKKRGRNFLNLNQATHSFFGADSVRQCKKSFFLTPVLGQKTNQTTPIKIKLDKAKFKLTQASKLACQELCES